MGEEPNVYLTGVGTPLSVTTKTGESYRVVPEEEVVAPLEERVKTCLVSIDDPSGATVGSGVLISESLILTTEEVLAAACSNEPTDGRERSAVRFPQLNVDHVIYATPAPGPRAGVQVDDGLVALNLESWSNDGYSPAVFGRRRSPSGRAAWPSHSRCRGRRLRGSGSKSRKRSKTARTACV